MRAAAAPCSAIAEQPATPAPGTDPTSALEEKNDGRWKRLQPRAAPSAARASGREAGRGRRDHSQADHADRYPRARTAGAIDRGPAAGGLAPAAGPGHERRERMMPGREGR